MKLSFKEFQNIESGTVFAKGIIMDGPNGLHMTNNSEQELRWLAKKGEGYDDWAVYVATSSQSYEYIEQYGDKVFSERNILKCIQADRETLNRYRR